MFQKNLFLKQKSMNGTKTGFPICRINQKTIFLQKKRKKERKVEVQFKGYEEYPEKFAWLREEDWKRFQEEVKQYLYVKGFETVTTVNLHPDTIQIINEYERNLYFDIDYRTDTSDTLTIKAVCDTYQESDQMRFGFEIQYGTGRE